MEIYQSLGCKDELITLYWSKIKVPVVSHWCHASERDIAGRFSRNFPNIGTNIYLDSSIN